VDRVVVLAPHPDDETIGCGATLLRHAAHGDQIHWLIMTEIPVHTSFNGKDAASRSQEIDAVAAEFSFTTVHELRYAPASLDAHPLSDLVGGVGAVLAEILPTIVYVPWPGDAHSDHRVSFEAGLAASKSFRSPSIKKILAYETLSETNFGIHPLVPAFRPNCYHDVTDTFARKLEILRHWDSELKQHPWPRSDEAVIAQAVLRGTECGAMRAEAFSVIRDFS